MKYYLLLNDGQCDSDRIVEADTLAEAEAAAPDEADDWCSDGEWGVGGAAIEVDWEIFSDEDHEDLLAEGSTTVEIEPDHDDLIAAAGGDPDCNHEWSSEGEGGCDENPGVWSTGGTAMVFGSHCARCGLRRTEYHTGSQRNPGEHDTVVYEQPDEVDD